MAARRRIVVGITGASGVIRGIRTAEALLKRGFEVHAIVTDAAWAVIRHEVGKDFAFPKKLALYGEDDSASPLNSSSFLVDAMVVAPCSMKSLAGIAAGYAQNLLIRAADGMLRFGKMLIVMPRETPLSLSALENMAALRRGGAVIMPPCAAYYHAPKSVDDMTDFFVGKILDALGVEHRLYKRWGGHAG
ncbi:MAG: UbiX family flavin prenyltransferase [Elusimicrobia bacterium]|nr:UbiX family flavin prenyltransferase [Elusimicrobiota bacterium]